MRKQFSGLLFRKCNLLFLLQQLCVEVGLTLGRAGSLRVVVVTQMTSVGPLCTGVS